MSTEKWLVSSQNMGLTLNETETKYYIVMSSNKTPNISI